MQIYVYQAGDSLDRVAEEAGSSLERLLYENALTEGDSPVPGQALLVLTPQETYRVQAGDTPASVAAEHGISIRQLLRCNPYLVEQPYLREGEELVIRYTDNPQREATVNGYAYPYIREETLRAALPYLTYLSVFSYGFTPEGNLVPPERPDEPLIAAAEEFGVQPLLVLTPRSGEEAFNSNLVTLLVNDAAMQENLIGELLRVLAGKRYRGVDVDFEYIAAEDRDAYAAFVGGLQQTMQQYGYSVSVALAPKTSAEQAGVLYEGVDYRQLGAAADWVLLMTYEWGYTYGPPMAVAPIGPVRQVVEYGLREIEPQKIDMGIPNYGYDWPLPYERGVTRATSIGNLYAVELARRYDQSILYDTAAASPWFRYETDGQTHEVWFEDVRSLQAKFELVGEKELRGVGYWNLMRPFRPNWLLLNAMFRIKGPET